MLIGQKKVNLIPLLGLIGLHVGAFFAIFTFSWPAFFVFLTLYWLSIGMGELFVIFVLRPDIYKQR